MIQKILHSAIWRRIGFVACLSIGAAIHAVNMFRFPYYENDEGTYISQAWSLLKSGKLAPYTYWYDHPPGGWIFIALWTRLTGGFFHFGASVNSGRYFMLVLHVLSAVLLFYVAKKISKSNLAGLIAIIVFSVSPLAVYFQRRVLLDNIMVFWLLLSLAILYTEMPTIMSFLLSGLIFGIAVLTKENALFFIPGLLYVIFQRADRSHRLFALVGWFCTAFFTASLYIAYALINREFFPSTGVVDQHVSLITSVLSQLGRGAHLPFWVAGSDFYAALQSWMTKDPLILYAGALAMFFICIVSIFKKDLRVAAFLSLGILIFFLRGALIIDFYVIVLIPFIALNCALMMDIILHKWIKNVFINAFILMILSIGLIRMYSTALAPLFLRNETRPQLQAVEWIKKNVPPMSGIAIDDFAYVDLHESRFAGDPAFPNADWVWKIEKDPDIRDKKVQNNWQNIQYIMLTHETVKQIKYDQFPIVKETLINSTYEQMWREKGNTYLNLEQYISTNGDWAAIVRKKDVFEQLLSHTWSFYKKNFIISYGQVINPSSNGLTSSEGQAYALLRAVYMQDKGTFDGVWKWTKDHMQFRIQDKLFSWEWKKVGQNYVQGDSENASDADVDIALSLLFAYKTWGDEYYKTEALQIIQDIWRQDVKQVNGIYFLTPSLNSARADGHLVNPSYFSPAHYRIFASVDPDHDWLQLVSDSYFTYSIIHNASVFGKNENYLLPNWLFVKNGNGDLDSAKQYVASDADTYGFDSFRALFRIVLDAEWFQSPEAQMYLDGVAPFFKSEWEKRKRIAAIYSLEGIPTVSYESIATLAGPMAAFLNSDIDMANTLYQDRIEKAYNTLGYWGDKSNYYDQNWVWFTTALYAKKLPNLFAK